MNRLSGWFDYFSVASKNRLQEAMFSVYLRDLTVPMLQRLGLVIIIFIGGVGELARFIYPDRLLGVATLWRFYVCLIIGALVLLTALFDQTKKWINALIGVAYVIGSVLCGYYLSQLRVPHSAGMYLIYLLPLLTIIMPAGLFVRTLVTTSTLLILPAMYFAIGWSFSLYSLLFAILLGSSAISILLGHGIFYRLNREAYFDDRELKRRQQQIEFLARHDQLTGLYNRREFENKLEEEFDRSRRYNSALSLLMIDLDHFKDVNDTYGHPAGDTVLRAVGELLNNEASESVRISDVPGRYGGEEFCLLLPETRPEGASAVGNRIRQSLGEKEFSTDDGRTFSVTCSIGVAGVDESMKHSEALVQAADEALYEAKNAGRNQVVVNRTE